MMKFMFRLPRIAIAATLVAAATQARLSAQTGVGSTGAQLLQMAVGSRASAFSGAYTAAQNDADVVFYNPADTASVTSAASLSYGRFVQDVALMSAAGAVHLGALTVAAGGAFLDAGSVAETLPDPNFGGQRGRTTGNNVSASESAVRIALGAPLV